MNWQSAAELRAVRGRWVFPVASPPQQDGVVTYSTADGQIHAVGPNAYNLPVEDLGDVAILPGLVNAHTHLEFSDLAQPLGQPGMSLPDWIRLVVDQRRHRTMPADEAIGRGLCEAERQQTALLCEIAASLPTEIGGLDLLAELYGQTAPSLAAVVCQEAIGLREERVEACLQRLWAWAGLRDTLFASIGFGFSPHAPYSVHPRLLEEIVENLATGGDVVAMHVAESREELELLQTGGGPFRRMLEDFDAWDAEAIVPGSRPLDYLHRLSVAERSLVIHGNYLDDEEIRFLAEQSARMSLVYCPRTHSFFGHDPYPLAKLLAAGVNVALGTDSRASNPDLNLLAELRHVAQRHPEVAPVDILQMATQRGARALGRQHHFGTLQAGKRAALCIVPVPPLNPVDPHELLLA